jgi:hypothetical protein
MLHFDIQSAVAAACRAISHHSGTVVHRYVELQTSIHPLLIFQFFVEFRANVWNLLEVVLSSKNAAWTQRTIQAASTDPIIYRLIQRPANQPFPRLLNV